jgi:two-component system response regulator AgrA
MNVYILEDEIVQQFRLEQMIQTYLKQKKRCSIEEVVVCSKEPELLAALKDMPQNNLYFVDIAIQGNQRAGLEVAEKVRQKDPIGQITFVTAYGKFAPITYTYKVNAHDFIDKLLPQDRFDQKIKENIDYFLETNRVQSSDEVFLYQTRTGKEIKAFYADIYYFETTSKSHQLLLQMDGETVSMYGNMDEIANISDRLVRVHRSYLVNRDWIKSVNKKEKCIILGDNTVIPVSRAGFKRLINDPRIINV